MDRFLNDLRECMITIDEEGKIYFCNKNFEDKLKYSYYEIKKHNFFDLTYCDKESFNVEDNKEKTIYFKDKENRKLSFKGKINVETFNKKKIIFVCGLFNEDKLYKWNELDKILGNMPFEIWIKNKKGEYLYVNREFEEKLNLSKSSILGKYDKELWAKSEYDLICKEDYIVFETKSTHVFNEVYNRDGEAVWGKTYKTPIYDEDGQVKYIIGMSKDVTLEKKVNINISKSYKDLESLNKILLSSKSSAFYDLIIGLKEDIKKNLHCDEVGIFIYNKRKEELKSILSAVNYIDEKDTYNISIKNEVFQEGVKKYNCRNSSRVEERKDLTKVADLKKRGLNFVSTYGIWLNDEALGLINVYYKEKYENSSKLNNYIKEICNQMAILIKNRNLSEDLQNEFNKRRELEKELELYLDISVDLIAIMDKDGKFIKVNKGWENSLGWSEEEIISKNATELLYEEDIEKTLEFKERLLKTGETRSFINRYKTKSGDIRWIDWNAKYIKEKEIFITTARDITEEKKIEKDRKLYKEALELESIKNEFFTNISHEFKTPLNIILSTMQLINSNVQNGNLIGLKGFDIDRYMNFIKQNSYRLLRIVNNLIDMTKIETGFYSPEFENHNIVEIIEEITVSVADYIEGKNIELVFDTNEEEKIIACDPDKLERVMLNLLSNAVKYAKKDGRIEVNLKVDKDWITVSVENDGLPIPKERLEEIFERFTQVENEITKVSKGSGIGLSLCKSLVEMHGGTIWAESGDGELTRFIFTLPVKVVKEEKINKVEVSSNNLKRDNVEKCTIEFSDIYE